MNYDLNSGPGIGAGVPGAAVAERWAKPVMDIVRNVACPGYEFHVLIEGGHVILRVAQAEADGMIGRPWIIEIGAHPHQIVATAYAALEAFAIHELRERFMYSGRHALTVPRTHNDFLLLWNMAPMPEQLSTATGGTAVGGVPENRPIGDVVRHGHGHAGNNPPSAGSPSAVSPGGRPDA